MDQQLPAVLLMGGGEGMGPVKKTAKALGEALFDKELDKPIGQLVIICGRNADLANTLQSLDWKIPVKVISNKFFYHNFYSEFELIVVMFKCRLEDLRSRCRNGWGLVIASLLKYVYFVLSNQYARIIRLVFDKIFM